MKINTYINKSVIFLKSYQGEQKKYATMVKHLPKDLRLINLSEPHWLSVNNVKLVEGATS